MTRNNITTFIGELINILSLPIDLAADTEHIKHILVLIIIRLFDIITRDPPGDYLASLLGIIKTHFSSKKHITQFITYFINHKGRDFIIRITLYIKLTCI